MKQLIFSITAAVIMFVIPVSARDCDDIRDDALFLTDKMAYELNLTEDQYEAAYEINYDYLYDVMCDDYDDLYGRAWKSRNRDLKIILLDSQYEMYRQLKYFYRPFHHSHGKVVINIYSYYPRHDFLYFGCPGFVMSYRGGHGWHHYRNHSFYSGRAWHRSNCYGMRDGYHRGHRYYHDGPHHGPHSINNGYRHRSHRDCHDGFRNTGYRSRVSSTRTTVNNRNRAADRSRSSADRARRLPDNKFSPRNDRKDK